MEIKQISRSFFSYILLLELLASTCVAYEKKYLSLGADVTIPCKSPTSGKPSFSGSFVRRNNTYEFVYMDTLYFLILDFSQNNRGTYTCVCGDEVLSVTSLELTEKPTAEEIVKFRPVGEDLIVHCKRLSKATQVQWDWTSYDSHRKATIKVKNDNIISDSNFDGRLKISSNFILKLSPVHFRDAGNYECHFSDQKIRTTFRIITVEVKASPSGEVFRGGTVSLTCSLSHLLPITNVILVWAKMTETGSFPVKTQMLNKTLTESSVLIKDVSEEKVNWTCLVFQDSVLVAFIPFQTLYRDDPNSYKTTASYSSVIISDDVTSNVVFLVRNICLLPAFAVMLLIICRTCK